MAITPLPPVPLRGDTPANFVTKADAFLAALNLFAAEVDAVGIALTLGATNSTSTTSLTIGTGSKSLTVQSGKSYVPGMTVKIASTADGANWMLGDVTSYNSGSGALVVQVAVTNGSGSGLTAWTVSQSAPGGAKPGANTDITSLASPYLADATADTQAVTDNSSLVATTSFVRQNMPAGTIIAFAGASPPAGYLACPTAAATISRTTYAALFAAIGTLWGAGDGSTTFGIPWFPADYTLVQAGTVGAATVGAVIAHSHTYTREISGAVAANDTSQGVFYTSSTQNTGSTGGAANLAAGHYVKFCVKY